MSEWIRHNGKRLYRAAVLGAVVAAAVCLFCGCRNAELEDRGFPMLGAVEKDQASGEISLSFVYRDLEKVSDEMTNISEPDDQLVAAADFYRAWHHYESRQDKVIDYNHMKALLINEAFLEDPGQFQELLSFLEEEHTVPRNTYVCIVESIGPLLACGEELSEDLGSYLEQMLEHQEKLSAKALPTLGTLFDDKKNGSETLFFPYFTVEDSLPAQSGYYCIRRGEPLRRVGAETAYLSFLSGEKLNELILSVQADGEQDFIRLRHFSARYQLKKEGTVHVKISCEGEAVYGEAPDNETVSKQVTEYFNRLAKENLACGIDVSNSYKKLGGYNRTWYLHWREKQKQEPECCFEDGLKIVYEVNVMMTTK